MIDIGEYNRQIRIERPITEKQPSGQEKIIGRTLVAEPWAKVRVLNGKEYITSGAEIASTAASFRIRWRSDITTDMCVVYAGTVYDIEAVLPDMAGRAHVDLACTVGKRKTP